MDAYSIVPGFKDGYLEQWNLNIQHEFGSSVVVQAGYYGTVGHRLPSETREINQPVYGPGATEQNAQARRPHFSQYYGSIDQITSGDNSAYHSVQINVDMKFSRGLTL